MSNLIGDRVGGWRRARNLTQAGLAARAGLPQSAVSSIESGARDCTLRTILRLAAALELTPGRLLDEDPPRPVLSRARLDVIARAVVAGGRDLPPDQRRLADACAGEMRPTLEAFGAPGAARARLRGGPAWRAAVREWGRDQVDLIMERVERLAGSAGARGSRG